MVFLRIRVGSCQILPNIMAARFRLSFSIQPSSFSSTQTRPSLGLISPVMSRSRVLFPEPLAPTTKTNSPCRMVRLTSSTPMSVCTRPFRRRLGL